MISSVTITVVVEIKPDAWSGYLENLPCLLKHARGFPALQDIRILEHKGHPNKLLFIEKWDTEADYNTYLSQCAKQGNTAAGLFTSPYKADPITDVWAMDVSGT